MSGVGDAGGPRPRRPDAPRARTLAVAASAATVALALGGQGLLVPAGPTSTLVRVGGALAALAAVAALVRLDGPLRGGRTLLVVAVAGALTALATLPASPVTFPGPAADRSDTAAPGEGSARTIVLDQVDPGRAQDATLLLPPGAELAVREGQVVVQVPGGATTVLAPGQRVADPDGTVVVVGPGSLLPVPDPLPVDPATAPDRLPRGVEVVLGLLLGAFALVAFAPPVVRVAERAMAPSPPDPAPPPTRRPPTTVEAGLAEVLRAMLADPDPRTAVIGAYAGLLAALEEVGFARRAEEGPHEHLWRSLGPLGVRRPPVHRLAELFVRARFTPRPVTDDHRRAAIGALADAIADLRLQGGDLEELAGAAGGRA